MDVLICAATRTEAQACSRGIKSAGLNFEVLRTGVGFENAADALSKRLERHPRPRLIVSTGFAGSLSEKIPLHSWITAENVLRAGGGSVAKKVLCRRFFAGAIACDLLSAPNLTLQSETLKEAMAVDMESAILGEIAESRSIPFLVLRFITDTPSAPLPGFVSSFASAMAVRGPLQRAKLQIAGVRGALGDLGSVLRLVSSGKEWSALFESGWIRHALFLSANIDEIVNHP